MPTGYPGLIIPFPEMLDTLVANGRSQQQAIAELKRALIDRALTLRDLHEPAWPDDQLLRAALNLLEAFAAGKRGVGAVPYLHPEYFKNGVVASRAQFDVVFGLAADPDSDPGAGRWSLEQIMAFTKNYFVTVKNPTVKDLEAKARDAGLKGNREGVRGAYERVYKEKFGAAPPRGRRRLH
jgi:hypothetical protein